MKLYCLLVTCLLLLTGCNVNYVDYVAAAESRLEYAKTNKGDIIIAAVQDSDKSSYINGVILAVEEINQHRGGLLGRNLKLEIEKDGSDFESSKPTIRRIVANPKVSAVLGHRNSRVAIPASIIYEKSQTLFLPSFSTAEGLTSHNFKYVFRMLPDNKFMAQQMSSVAETLGYRNIAVLYARDDYNRELGFLFEEAAVKRGLKLVFRASFFGEDTHFRSIISDLNNEDFDAVFLSAEANTAATMVKQLREMGIDTPILGSDSLSSKEFKTSVGLAGNRTIVPTLYNSQLDNVLNRQFVSSYRDKHKELPDADAAQGYDSVLLFADTVERAQSTVPTLLKTTLHFIPPWMGVTGIHRYDKKGDILGKKYFFQALHNEQWHMLPAIHRPFFLEQFEHHLARKKSAYQRKVTPYSQVLSANLQQDEYKKLLLDLAHETLNFKSLGVIYEDTDDGRKIADYDLISQVAREKSFSIKSCKIQFSKLDKAAMKKELTACYERLPLNADALYLPTHDRINNDQSRKSTTGLNFLKIPVIAIEQGKQINPAVTLDLKHLQLDLQDPTLTNIFEQLLSGIKIQEFQKRLSNLPDISVNLRKMQEHAISTEEFLKLSPDFHVTNRAILKQVSTQ